jgi:beta-glucosidase
MNQRLTQTIWLALFAVVGSVIDFVAAQTTQAPPAPAAKRITAQDSQAAGAPGTPLYLNSNAPLEERVNDLLSRMTLEEKISQMQDVAPAIPRLGIPAYNWWNEGLHGVARAGTATVFPQAIGLAATWDTDLVHRVGDVISTEARAKYNDATQHGNTGRYFGLTFWSPNINIFRDPRWGRGQETYGEDPFLTARMAVAFVTGLQGDNPNYLKAVSTPKHFAVHSGPDVWRHTFDPRPTAHDLADTYTPAFRASIVEGKADSVMCAYNSVNGAPACANEKLFDLLRKQWGFRGYVVSDCGAIGDIYRGHGYVLTLPEAAAVSVRAGTDLSCGNEFEALSYAVPDRMLTPQDIDQVVRRLFEARFRLGMFDPPERVPWSKLTLADNDTAEHRQLALEAARESIVLLKNDRNTLPLKPNVKNIAVIGPNADSLDVLLGNYNGMPSRYSTILDGIRKRFPGAKVTFSVGSIPVETMGVPISKENLRTGGANSQAGLTGEYFANMTLEGRPLVTRVDPNIDFAWSGAPPAPGIPASNFSVRWTGELVPQTTGDYRFGLSSEGNYGLRLFLAGKLLIDDWMPRSEGGMTSLIHLERGQTYPIRVEYAHRGWEVAVHLLWQAPDFTERAVAAAREADAIVTVVGLTAKLEGEESGVSAPGFFGGDRVDLALPAPQQKLLEGVAATGRPLIIVLTSGSAVAVNWAQEHASAILEAWYPGEEGGTAVADLLSGAYNPSGRLPVTFYKSVEQLPSFANYSMTGRTYRYFTEQPLYAFGYGLSYSTFRYEKPEVEPAEISADGTVSVSARVTNTGKNAGDEVVELYLTHPGVDGAPIRSLTGLQRLHFNAGESKTVKFSLRDRDLSIVDAQGIRRIVPGEVKVWIGGGQPVAGPGQAPGSGAETSFRIAFAVTLPE